MLRRISLLLFLSSLFLNLSAQALDLGIEKINVYKWVNGKWKLNTENTYFFSDTLESSVQYAQREQEWVLSRKHIRRIALNQDTVHSQLFRLNTNQDTTFISKYCYHIRDANDQVIDLMVNGVSKARGNRNIASYHIKEDTYCKQITYPFHLLFQKTEERKREGRQIDGVEFEYNFCQRRLFKIHTDNQNRPILMESPDYYRLEVFYREPDNTEQLLNANASVYPNPSRDRVTVDFVNQQSRDLQLLTPQGRVVVQQLNTQDRKINLDLSNLPAGLYWLIISVEDETVYTERIVKI